ncbi:MAG: flagellar motor switch protein FliM [Eubacteriales bacterium]
MGDVLSQNEIDSLLQSLSTGSADVDEMQQREDVRKIMEYDFKRPAKFSKEHLRTLEIIFEHYSRLLSTNLPGYLRKNVQVSVMSSEAVTFSEFINALGTPTLMGIVNFAPLSGKIIMEISVTLAYAIVDRLLGGDGTPLEKNREFSEIELLILERIIVVCVQLFREPWKNVVELNPVLEVVETNAQFAQILSPNEMMAIVTLNIEVGNVSGLMNICLPHMTLENVIDKLNTKFWFTSIHNGDGHSFGEYIEESIERVNIPLRATLGESAITVTDFMNLQVGDVIRLDSHVEKELDIFVGDIRKFTALPGTNKDRYAVRVTSVIGEGE